MGRGIHRPDKMDNRSSLYSRTACQWESRHGAEDPNEYTPTIIDMNTAGSAPAVAGDEIYASFTGTVEWLNAPTSVLFTFTIPGGETVVLKVTGENQFGDVVSENLTFVGTSTNQTTWCYRRITAVLLVSTTGVLDVNDTLDAGVEFTAMRLPMWCRSPSQGQLLAIGWTHAPTPTQPTLTVNPATANVTVSQVPASSSTYVMYLDTDYDNRS